MYLYPETIQFYYRKNKPIVEEGRESERG